MRSFMKDTSVRGHRLAPGTIGRILAFGRPYRGLLTVFLFLVAVDATVGAVTPLLFRAIIDRGITPGRTDVVVSLAGVVALLALLSAAATLAQRWFSARIGEGLVFDLRTAVFDHVQGMPVAFFSRTQTGALIQRLNGDVLGAQQAFTSTLSNVVSNLLSVVLVLAAMLAMSWQITLLALVLLPLFVLPARMMAPRLRAATAESYRLNATMAQTMTERFNVAGAMLAKLFGRPQDSSRDFAGKAARVRDIGVTTATYAGIFRVSLTLVAALAVALVYGLGGVFAVEGALGIGTVVALTAYLTRLYGPLTSLSNLQVDVMTTLVSFERVLEVLDLPPMVADRPDGKDLPVDVEPTLEFDHVSFRYPSAAEVSLASLESVATLSRQAGEEVLRDVSFEVAPGRMVAVVGPSGAGKTTLASLVSRLYDVTGGAVRVGGHDVRSVTQQSLRSVIGVVTQDSHMYHDTIRANLLLARPNATEADLWAALDAARIGPLVAGLPDGLDTVVGDRGYRLSGGERQRLAIARLLLKAPSIVILDEATAHLDSESEAAVQAALATALTGRTSLVIAHRLSTVRDADEILVLDEGQVRERGTHERLLAAGGLYAELYRTQFARQDGEGELAAVPTS
ncbi:ABC transporter ATP-binding protein [Actinopolymorpha singaporensis]|uniref:ATP-binding cassette, subfamily B n=1 Tax=Actinopolymorpha singaporensis TaxID=117157 RepID=A0A1H1UA17_9ACTN|nr:ABC transporter ATP-binding protein [Actinopolymorpha singaporensis]SDS69362.1 ATP-binding cassette, subfamily B [Actinopolymorpha singaporensis]